MKLPRRQPRCEVPSVAMGDIAFNLVIFFVCLARVEDDSHLRWQPAASVKIQAGQHARCSIVIDQENRLYLNGQELGVAQLAQALRELLQDAPAGDRRVVMKVHKDALAQRFEPVIEAVSEAGGELFHVLEREIPP